MSDSQTGRFPVQINPPVFFGSAIIAIALVLFTIGAPEHAKALFSDVQSWVVGSAGWFYILAVAIFVIFVVLIAISDYGRIKLGPDHSEPSYSYGSWFAILFSAGMGIGLMFYGVAEPVMHYLNPPAAEAGSVEAARDAMRITFFHWGVHAWAIYAVVALALAYFSFRQDLPLTIRSALYPLIGERIHGPIGHAVDIFAVLGTLFGVATSLGLGVIQGQCRIELPAGYSHCHNHAGHPDRRYHYLGDSLRRNGAGWWYPTYIGIKFITRRRTAVVRPGRWSNVSFAGSHRPEYGSLFINLGRYNI